MTKAFVTIEVNLNTWGFPVQEGLGESSNPQHPPRRSIDQGKRDFIWDTVCEWLSGKQGFVQIKEVRLPKVAEL